MIHVFVAVYIRQILQIVNFLQLVMMLIFRNSLLTNFQYKYCTTKNPLWYGNLALL